MSFSRRILLYYGGRIVASGALLAVIISFFYPWQQSLGIAFGAIYILFLPGFIWSFAVWPIGTTPGLNRLIMSIFLSLVTMPLLILLANRSGWPDGRFLTSAMATVVILLGLIGLKPRRRPKAAASKDSGA